MLTKSLQDFFNKTDQSSFKFAEKMSTSPAYQKVIDFIGSLEEREQKIAGQLITLGVIFLPFLITLIINFWNSSLRFEVDTYKEITDQIQHFNYKNSELISLGQGSLGSTPINGQDDLSARLKSLLTAKSIPGEKVTVVLFDDVGSTKHLKNIEASIRFSDFTMSDLNIFLNALTQIEKFKILEFQINKNESSAKIGGILRVLHMAKDQSGTP